MRYARRVEWILRAATNDADGLSHGVRRELVFLTALCGALYGGAMGAFGALEGQQFVQIIYGALKVPMLLLCTFAIGLPSFLVLNTLAGLRRDFRLVVEALLSTQTAVAIVLASLAPITVLWYCSHAGYVQAIFFNGIVFAVASGAAQQVMRAHYRRLVVRNPRHRTLLRVWIILYAGIAIQMAWLLRPFVGNPNAEISFFRPDAFSKNAYEVVARIVWSLVAP